MDFRQEGDRGLILPEPSVLFPVDGETMANLSVRIRSPFKWSSGTPTVLGLLVPEDEATALLH